MKTEIAEIEAYWDDLFMYIEFFHGYAMTPEFRIIISLN